MMISPGVTSEVVKDMNVDLIKTVVHAAMSVHSSPIARLQSYEVIELFKSRAHEHIDILKSLLSTSEDKIFRHFGMQMLEHIIKQRWNELNGDGKLRMKDLAMGLMRQNGDILSEPPYIKDAISRCIVEIVKREYPQNWPNFLQELSDLSSPGVASIQTELVMLVLLRLAEDVVILNTVPAKRRKDILQELTGALSTIVPFFLANLSQNVDHYKHLKLIREPYEAPLRLAVVALEAITAYADWMPWASVTYNDNQLIKVLYTNLDDDLLQLSVAECLLVVISRRGKVDDRALIMLIFSREAMEALLFAARKANGLAFQSENYYKFLKRLCQLVVAAGTQLCTMWAKDPVLEIPATIGDYLEALLSFTEHNSISLNHTVFPFWSVLMKLPAASTVVRPVLDRLMGTCVDKLKKVGAPSESSHPSCIYSRLDFDSDSDFYLFFNKHRSAILEVIRHGAHLNPQLLLTMCNRLVREQHRVTCLFLLEQRAIHSKSQIIIDWEAISCFQHQAMPVITTTSDPDTLSILEELIGTDVKEPHVLSQVLSCLSALFPFVPNTRPGVLNRLLLMIFDAVKYRTTKIKDWSTLTLRRHACAIFVKLALQHPKLLQPLFDDIHKLVMSSILDVDNREFRTLLEALVLISNALEDYNKQEKYFEIILRDTIVSWNSESVQRALSSPVCMAQFIGIQQGSLYSQETSNNRFLLQDLLKTILGVARRAETPTNLQVIHDGNFTTPEGVIRCPASTVLLPFMEGVMLSLSSTLGLYHPTIVQTFHADYARALGLPYAERCIFLGLPFMQDSESKSNRSPLEWMQKHILEVVDNSCQLLHAFAEHLPNEFYRLPNLADILTACLAPHLDHVNEFCLKVLIRGVLKPICFCCPCEFKETIVSPLVKNLFSAIVRRLDRSWQKVKDEMGSKSSENYREGLCEEEIIEDELLRLCTREYLDTIMIVSMSINTPSPPAEQPLEQMTQAQADGLLDEENDDVDMEIKETLCDNDLSEYIKSAPQDVVELITWSSLLACCWGDSSSAHRALALIQPLTMHIFTLGRLSDEMACQVLGQCLLCAHLHGQHEFLCTRVISCILKLYETLSPKYPSMRSVLLQAPGITEGSLQEFETNNLAIATQKKPQEKRRRQALRRLLDDLIGKNVGQQFKAGVVIKNLPALLKFKPSYDDVLSASEAYGLSDDVGLSHLFGSNPR